MTFHMDGLKQLDVQSLHFLKRLEHIKHALLRLKVIAESHRDSLDLDVLGHFADPFCKTRFKGIAVRAAVPEKLDHLDLAFACIGAYTFDKREVFATSL